METKRTEQEMIQEIRNLRAGHLAVLNRAYVDALLSAYDKAAQRADELLAELHKCQDKLDTVANGSLPDLDRPLEWEVDCPNCATFRQIQKGEPTICPKCGETDIDTRSL